MIRVPRKESQTIHPTQQLSGWALREIGKETNEPSNSAADKVRTKYLAALQRESGRNIICYYSGFLSKPKLEGVEINDEDKNGFMLCVHRLDRSKGLDLFLHTPGGDGAATASLVHYLKEMFGKDIRAFVPQIAMSAGTLIACSCKEIFMGKHSNIGPVDPQINGLPAYGVVEELKTAYAEITTNNLKQYIWNPILSRYTPSFVQQCQWAIERSKGLIGEYLAENMFSQLSELDRRKRVDHIVECLTDLTENKGHDKHIHYKECLDMGLEVKMLEDAPKALQDLVLTVHHCYMFSLSNSGAFKIIENHLGRRFVKLQLAQPQMSFNLPQELIEELMRELKGKGSSASSGTPH